MESAQFVDREQTIIVLINVDFSQYRVSTILRTSMGDGKTRRNPFVS